MLKIRPAEQNDVDAIFDLIIGLAAYEKLSDRVVGSRDLLRSHLFGVRPAAEVVVAEIASHSAGIELHLCGFALFFQTYSTFLTQPGLYLEDVFVAPEYRRQGVGTALLTEVTKIAHDRGCGRLEWSVLDWNQSAIDFYDHFGATVLPEWRICRMTADKLMEIATKAQI